MTLPVSRSALDEQRIQSEIVNAAVANHTALTSAIAVNEASAQLWDEAAAISTSLHRSLQTLQTRTTDLAAFGNSWRREKQLASSAVAHHQKLVELLDAPQTLDICLRNEMFHEAMLVLDFVKNLTSEQRERGVEVSVVSQLRSAVELALRSALLHAVLPRLAQPIPLNTTVKIITFLRRVQTPEAALVALFFSKKDELVEQLLKDAESMSHTPYSLLSKYAGIYKVHVAEAVAQFHACFSGPDAARSHAQWCADQSAAFVRVFASKLVLVTNGSEIASLMEQVGNCSAAAAKVGLDVTDCINELLCQRAFELFSSQLSGATTTFRAAAASFSWKLPASATASASRAATGSSTNGQSAGAGAAIPPPPSSLLHFLPLAYAMNGAISALNEVRRCAAKCLAPQCCDALVAFIGDVVAETRKAQRVVLLMDSQEQQACQAYTLALRDEFTPHLLLCAERVFSESVEVVAAAHSRARQLVQDLLPAAAASPTAQSSAAPVEAASDHQHQSAPDTAAAE